MENNQKTNSLTISVYKGSFNDWFLPALGVVGFVVTFVAIVFLFKFTRVYFKLTGIDKANIKDLNKKHKNKQNVEDTLKTDDVLKK